MTEISAPWLKFFGQVPPRLEYFQGAMWEGVFAAAEKDPYGIAYEFMGKKTTYGQMRRRVLRCARGLKALGVNKGDRVTVCLPNCPQAVEMFYAVNLIGAVSNMVHPLSGEKEIEFFLKEGESRVAVTLDGFYGKFAAIGENVKLDALIVTSVSHAMPLVTRVGYALTEGRKTPKIPMQAPVIGWKQFLACGDTLRESVEVSGSFSDPAVILYSGGTTGTTKGILLSNGNFNALAQQIKATNPMFSPRDRMLAVMPIFHGFGLGVSIHSMLFNGGRCLLVPRFTVKSYGKLLRRYRCNYIAGVPTLYEALLREPSVKGANLSSLKGVFSGGDTLSPDLKRRFDAFLKECGAQVRIREGYGTTECVTASCLTPYHTEKEGSIGIPFPDTYYKIVTPETDREVPYGEEGEICLSGPTVMLGYLNRPEETETTLRRHGDGHLWVHTGDLGVMDEDGFVYFRQRIKRVIVTNGYNVYPSRIESVLEDMEEIVSCCVIGVPDPLRMQSVKAFVVLRSDTEKTDGLKQKILEYCGKYVAKYALPREIEFRDALPKTSVGKVAYRVLEQQEAEKRSEKQEKEV